MSRANNGIYTLPNTVNPVVAGTDILDTWANLTLDDVAQGLTDSLDRNGRGSMNAPFRTVPGAVNLPAYSFSVEPTMGFYRSAPGQLAVAVGGIPCMAWGAAGVSCFLPLDASTVNAATVLSNTVSAVAVNAGTLTANANVTTGPLSANTGAFPGGVTAGAGALPASLTPLSQVQGLVAEGKNVPFQITQTLVPFRVAGLTANITLPNGFAPGDVYGVYNQAGSPLTISPAVGLTLRLSGTGAVGARTLPAFGLAMIYVLTDTQYIISGNNLS